MGNQKRWYIVLMISVLLFALCGCCGKNTDSSLHDISKMIGVDISSGEVLSESDSHGGFHGDGTAVVEIQFTDTALSEQIEENEEWNPLPLTETLTALVYGIQTENSSVGPMIHDGDGTPLIPVVENGYYFFWDRHSESTDPKDDSGVLGRGSYNFTIAIFDADHQILYYLELDT